MCLGPHFLQYHLFCYDVFVSSDIGIDIQYHTDASVFNLRGFQAKTKVKTEIVEFLFTDDSALNATTKANMKNSADKFSVACNNFWQTINRKKTEVMHQPASGKQYVEWNIPFKVQQLKMVQKIIYFNRTLSESTVMDDDVNARVAKTNITFGQLNRNMWNRWGISEATKIKVYRAVVFTTLFYFCETLTTNQRHMKKLNHFRTTCLRKILGITWQKYTPNGLLFSVYIPSWCNYSFVGADITASHGNWSPWNLSVSLLISWKIWRKTETSGVKLPRKARMSVKQERMQLLKSSGSIEKALCHHIAFFSLSKILPHNTYARSRITFTIIGWSNGSYRFRWTKMMMIIAHLFTWIWPSFSTRSKL